MSTRPSPTRSSTSIEVGAGTFEMPWHRPGISFDIPKNALTEQQLSRQQHSLALDRCRREEVRASKLGHLQTVAGTRRPSPQGREGVIDRQSMASGSPKEPSAIAGGQPKHKQNSAIAGASAQAPKKRSDVEQSKAMFAKAAWVFNAAQVDGLYY